MKTVHYNDLPGLVGQEIGVSDWQDISQERINQFADVTRDHQWIHVDEKRAKEEMGSTIAHGFLVLSFLPHFMYHISKTEGVGRVINYGLNKVRFTTPVPSGSRVRARQTLLEAEPKGKGMQLINEFVIELEGSDRPACIAEFITICYPEA